MNVDPVPAETPEPAENPTQPGPRRSACAAASLAAELERVRQMTVEERIKAALSMGDRFTWLAPAERTEE